MTTAAAEERESVGPYRVVRAIGAGGSARIDLARIDRAYGFQRHVVIKRPLEHLRGNPQVAASLRREARIGGVLRHPNLVAVLDAGIHDDYDYLVLEYVHGAALRALMQTELPGQVRELPRPVALAIVCDVARGMHEAHELTDDRGSPLGLVHRDVSPGNILLGLDGSVKLADFGIAKETRVSTLSGSMHGTVTYMAPEQCQGHAFDRRADVFSLGVILYELVTGTRLFWADNDVASLHRVLSGAVPRPRKLDPNIPAALEDILMTAVAHDADKRFATAAELATALELHAAGTGEVLGARWIARAIEDVVGPKQEPWAAAVVVPKPVHDTIPDVPPRDPSLVDLITASGADEPPESTFGDAGDAAVTDDEPQAAPPNVSDASDAPADPAVRAPRRPRALLAGIIALGLLGGSAATAILMTRRSPPTATVPARTPAPSNPATSPPGSPPSPNAANAPASPTSATSPNGSGAPSSGTSPNGTGAPPLPNTANAPASPTSATSPNGSGAPSSGTSPNRSGAPSSGTSPNGSGAPASALGGSRAAPSTDATPAVGKKKRRVPPPARSAPSTTSRPAPESASPARDAPSAPETRAGDAEAPPSDAGTTAAPTAGAGTGSSQAPPQTPARPPKVQWKPTLLLPTDGSAARAPR